uniref:protein S-acyltransferase n=1 Tax=Anopheles minimus TaxID=112268 RepID=A0A182WA98_9DIPT
MAPSQKVTKKWEIFAGRNKFFCDGHLMTAPNSGVFYFTVILITATSGLFFVFDCPFLAQRITPAIPIIGGILFIFTLSSLFRTAFSDPGIIPRASQDEAAYIEKQIEVPNSLNSPTYRPPPRTKEVFVKGQTVKLKYCFTCKIFRPPRASHCSLCDNCVDRFDHHCPWVGNCVGKRNYRFFYMFIVSLAFLAVFIFSCTTTHIVMLLKEDTQFIDVVKRTPSSVIIAIICFCSVWSVIGLAGFHTYLTTSDQTTNEDIKGSFSSKGGQQAINPYSQGNICLNCFHILCGPIPPSLIDRRGAVTDEYRTQMQATDKYNSATVPPLVLMQPAMDTLNKHYSMDHELQNATNGGGAGGNGVYRQRSYDNLQNGKSTSPASSVNNGAFTSLNHLNVTNSNYATAAPSANAAKTTTKTNLNNHPPTLNHLQHPSQSTLQCNNLSLSYVNLSPNLPQQPQLYHHSVKCNLLNLNTTNNHSSSNNASFRNRHNHQQRQLLPSSTPVTNIPNNANNYATFDRAGFDLSSCAATVSLQSLLPANHPADSPVPIPTNFKYFAPQSKYGASGANIGNGAGSTYFYSDQSQLLGSSLGGGISPSTVLLRSGIGGGPMPLLKSQSEFLHTSQQSPHPLVPNGGSSVSQQQLLQQKTQPLHMMSLNMTLPRYPYHRNRAIGIRKSSHDLQFPIYQHQPLEDGKQTIYGSSGTYSPGPYCLGNVPDSSTNSLNNHYNPAATIAPIVIPYSNGLMLKDSSASSSSSGGSSSTSASTATISSNSTSSATSSLDRRCRSKLPPSGSGSGSYLASYDTITTLSDHQQQVQHQVQQQQNFAPHTCPNSPRTIRCGSPGCSSELDPMLHTKGNGGGKQHTNGGYHRHRHHRQQQTGGYAKFYRKPSYQMKSSQLPNPPLALQSPMAGPATYGNNGAGTNPVSPALSFSQFSPSFWSANTCVSSSNRSSMLSSASTLGGGSSTPYVECTNGMNGSDSGGGGMVGGAMGEQRSGVTAGGGGVGGGGGMGNNADKSNSVAHLVENEVPLSTTGNVSMLSGGGGIVGQDDITTTTVLLDEDGIELETRAMGLPPDDSSNKLTGSYTNLFRESLTNGSNNDPMSGQQGKHKYHHSNTMMSECDKIQSADEIINVSELMMVCSVSGHENLYSNVPPAEISPSGSAVGLLSTKRASVGSSNVSGIADVSTVATVVPGGYQHVYSNVTGAGNSAVPVDLSPVPTGNGTVTQQLHSHHAHHHHLALDDPSQLLSSSFISNDLDLDDPVLSSSFATAKTTSTMTKMQPPSSANHSGAVTLSQPQQQPHLKQPPTMITTIEMKNVIKTIDPNVIIQQSSSANSSGGTARPPNTMTPANNASTSNGGPSTTQHHHLHHQNNTTGESPMFISPSASRMRLLQESTMIDTALDLDSLDGSIGNHSQSCLVKTAIV